MIDSLKKVRAGPEAFLINGWCFIVRLTNRITEPHKTSFQSIILDDPSFPDLILNSLKLTNKDVRENTVTAITNIVAVFPQMREKFMKENLVGRMFEAVDFVSLPLSESKILLELTYFIKFMLFPTGNDEAARFEQYPIILVSVFEPAKQFITFIFHNSDKLILDEENTAELENCHCLIHRHVKNLELRSDEHNADFVSELVTWEMHAMVEMENEANLKIVFQSMLGRTWEWNRDNRERQKRREVRLREEGWDDAFELRVVGINADTNQLFRNDARWFRIELALNADSL
ncbi:hypothetical protein BLNAU_20580 [Blattamonas nauphoetae]|uniref:Uncharacterized protein n=1 Tax=Blattamonas nauphoetae TaxID=2049346 RepID=A0ABQ9WY85_9EUKA|nr:hypothetical protein BLNAU_20580 [Blattamonas nauphoetae]